MVMHKSVERLTGVPLAVAISSCYSVCLNVVAVFAWQKCCGPLVLLLEFAN